MHTASRRVGFSLIEVNLAIFIVAMGMLTLFTLFPSGLKQAETAHENTQEALFADHVLSTLRTEAMLADSVTWTNLPDFQKMVRADVPPGVIVQHSAAIKVTEFPDKSGFFMRYLLELGDAGNGLRSAKLWCRSGQYGATNIDIFKAGAAKYYTEMFYSGMP